MKKSKAKEEIIYDYNDTSDFIDKKHPLRLKDLGFTLPDEAPTKVISIRIPTKLYNAIRAMSTDIDIPYQALIKYLLSMGIKSKIGSKIIQRHVVNR